MRSLYVYTLFILVNLTPPVQGQTSTQAKDLRTELFTTNAYDKKIRPQLDQSQATDVQVSFYLLALNELDEVAETLKTTGFLLIEWIDEHLSWNASDYGGIDTSFWPQGDVWKPDVTLKNSYKEYKELGSSGLNVQVTKDGHVLWAPFQVFQSTCTINVESFPFDEQTCFLRFVAWSYTKDQVLMAGGSKGIELEQYTPNSAWDIKDTSWSVEWESDEASVKFVLHIKRKPMFIILNTILPIMMLALLNVLAFALPCDSGEKASYAVTVFLAFAVFLTIISTTLPENSDSTSVFSVYVVLLTIQSTMITSICLIMVRMSNFGDDTEIPKVLVFITRLVKCQFCRRSRKVDTESERGFNGNDVKKIDLKQDDGISYDEKDDDIQVTWKSAMNALDLVLIVLFSLIFVLATIVCMVMASNG